jgi:hypothetical protein
MATGTEFEYATFTGPRQWICQSTYATQSLLIRPTLSAEVESSIPYGWVASHARHIN